MNQRVICVILGGGRGTRLHPLTQNRCKPAVPLGGKYRLVDISISNCINSGYNKIYVLTQFNTASLHRHIHEAYKYDPFGGGFIDILSAEQREEGGCWYQGTADAVRQNMCHFKHKEDDIFLLLSGDQLYRMNFEEIINHHKRLGAEVTIAATLVPKEKASGLGIMRVRDDFSISEFVEKPQDPALVEQLVIGHNLCSQIKDSCKLGHCLASMGIYVFNASALRSGLENQKLVDFGKEVIPSLLGKAKLYSYIFDGYWEDIGTIRSFFEANLMLADPLPLFDFFNSEYKIFTQAHFLPPSKIIRADIGNSVVTDGAVICNAVIWHSVIGMRSIVREGSYLENVLMMGADHYDKIDHFYQGSNSDEPRLGIGRNCRILKTIIDKNAHIGDNVRLSPYGLPEGYEQEGIYVHDGILIVSKNTIVPSNTHVGQEG